MNVMALLDYLQEEVEQGSKVPLSTRCMVDREKCLDIINDIRQALPNEIMEAETIRNEKNQILYDAEKESESIIAEAEEKVRQMVEEQRSQDGVQTSRGDHHERPAGAQRSDQRQRVRGGYTADLETYIHATWTSSPEPGANEGPVTRRNAGRLEPIGLSVRPIVFDRGSRAGCLLRAATAEPTRTTRPRPPAGAARRPRRPPPRVSGRTGTESEKTAAWKAAAQTESHRGLKRFYGCERPADSGVPDRKAMLELAPTGRPT